MDSFQLNDQHSINCGVNRKCWGVLVPEHKKPDNARVSTNHNSR